LSPESRLLRVRGGELEEDASWNYAWLLVGDAHPVVYVGATGLAPETRTWLHLHDDDPEIGRVRARYPSHADEPLDVVALRLQPGVARRDARQAAIAAITGRGLLSERYFGFEETAEAFAPEVAAAGDELCELVVEYLGRSDD
jgi:hypothetical protein